MAEAAATSTRWVTLAKVFARYAKIYGETTAKRDLSRLLSKVSWKSEQRGQGPLGVGDPQVWRPGSGEALSILWAESRIIRATAPRRIIVRPGETAYRQAPHRYEFVRIEIAIDELLALMPEDVRAKMEGGLSGFFSRRKPTPVNSAPPRKTKVEIAAEWIAKAFPERTTEGIPASKAIARIKDLGGPDVTETTFQRAAGRRKKPSG